MAGEWLPMRLDLHEDPAVIHIAQATGMDEHGVIGRLHKLWSWANRQLANGHAPSVTEKWIDAYTSAPNFASAMVFAGWLLVDETGVTIPKFDVWNSKSAKRRLLASRRQRDRRNQNVTPTAQQKRDQRREEKSINPPTPLAGDLFDQFWSVYPRKDGKTAARKAWRKLKPDPALVARLVADVQRRAGSAKWQENDGEFIPHASTYLNGRRWEDEGVNLNGSAMDPEIAARYAAKNAEDD